jgi:hypothetical protein
MFALGLAWHPAAAAATCHLLTALAQARNEWMVALGGPWQDKQAATFIVSHSGSGLRCELRRRSALEQQGALWRCEAYAVMLNIAASRHEQECRHCCEVKPQVMQNTRPCCCWCMGCSLRQLLAASSSAGTWRMDAQQVMD